MQVDQPGAALLLVEKEIPAPGSRVGVTPAPLQVNPFALLGGGHKMYDHASGTSREVELQFVHVRTDDACAHRISKDE